MLGAGSLEASRRASGGTGDVRCLMCGRQHHPIWTCDPEIRTAYLVDSFAVDSDASTAAETLNIERYDEWRNGGGPSSRPRQQPGERT